MEPCRFVPHHSPLSLHSTSGKNGVPVMTKPHPTNPDYEYVYYYDYEEEGGEGQDEEEASDNAVRTTQSSPPSTRTSPSSRVRVFLGRGYPVRNQ